MEILSSEEVYVEGLSCLSDIYLKELKVLPEEILPKTVLNPIISNVTVIHNFNNAFLNELSNRMNQFHINQEMIGDIFLKYSRMFKVYFSDLSFDFK